jgi:membrane dipeptidase
MSHYEEAIALHQQHPVVDAHHDILMDVLVKHKKGQRGVLSGEWGPRLQAAGVNVQILPAFVEDRYLPGLGLREAFRTLEAALADVEYDNSVVELATDIQGIHDSVQRDKIAGVLALEGCDGLEGDPAMLRLMYRLGVRMVGFTWERRNAFADGTGVRNPGGLTAVGRTALHEMMKHPVVFDVSHLAEPGFRDAMNIVDKPIIASHSNASAVLDHPRNLTNEQIKAIAQTNGVIGLNFVGFYIDAEHPTCERMADHLIHIAELVGIEHVGLGPDLLESPLREPGKEALKQTSLDPALLDNWIDNCQQVEQLPQFTATLIERGLSEDDIAAVLGGNFMRVFEAVWS